jgi:hypothetical protein
MKIRTLALCMTLSIGAVSNASADNSRAGYNNGYAGGGPLLATIAAGAVLSLLAGQRPVVAQPNTYYPTTVQPVLTMPFSGVRCELNSQMINGQLVQGQICR